MAIKAANREPCTPPRSTLILTPAFVVYTELGIDPADALKIANYALTFWTELKPYSAEDELRQLLKMQCRLYERTLTTSVTLRNGLISLLDPTFPEINRMFHPLVKQSNGHVRQSQIPLDAARLVRQRVSFRNYSF